MGGNLIIMKFKMQRERNVGKREKVAMKDKKDVCPTPCFKGRSMWERKRLPLERKPVFSGDSWIPIRTE